MKHGVLVMVLLINLVFAGCSGRVVAESADPDTAPPPQGAPAAPGPSQIFQPDGSVVTVVLKGDEWKNWVETIDGYTIAKGKDGFWYYVTGYEGKVPILSRTKVDGAAGKGREKHIRPK